MSCIYEYYKEEDYYFPRLYCKLGGYCIYSKKCLKENKFIPLDNQKECYIMIEEIKKDIPKGSYYVQTYRPNKNGLLYLYVVIENKVVKINSNFKEINQNYVYLKENLDGYDVSLVPFVVEKEKNTIKKKTTKTENKNYEK